MRIIQFLVFVLFVAADLSAQNNKMTLKQCIETALKNNIPVQQSGLQSEAADVNLRQARSNYLPNLNGSFGYGFNQGRNVDPLTNNYINQTLTSSNVGLSSGVVLFNGFRLQNQVKQNSFTYEASKMDWQQAKDNLEIDVIRAYLQTLMNEDVLAVAKGQLEVTKKQIERMEVMVKEGAAANYQLADLKGQMANEQIAIINSTNNLEQSKLSLCQLMNIDYDPVLQLDNMDMEFPAAKYADSPSAVYQSSLQSFSMIKANDFRIRSAEKGIKVARSGFFPLLSLNANIGSSYSSLAETLSPTSVSEIATGDYVMINGNQNPVLKQQQNYSGKRTAYGRQLNNNLGTFVGISMQVPLFNRFQTRNQVKLAELSLKNTKMESENQKLLLKQGIEQAHLNMTASFDRYKALAEQVANFEESFRAADVRFTNGVINSAEYLISKNNLDRSKINFTQAKYEYSFRVRLLDFYKGVK